MKKILIALTLVFLVVGSTSVFAGPRRQGPCVEDIKKFCADVKMGGGRIFECLKSHEADLSAACKESRANRKEQFKEARQEHMAEIKQSNKEVREACKEDVKKLCSDKEPGERTMQCMREKMDQASEGCKKELAERRSIHKEIAKDAMKAQQNKK